MGAEDVGCRDRPIRPREVLKVKEKRPKKLTKKQWLTLCAIGSVHFSGAICISLQAPFYPKEAELKGATATEYGLVFGSFEFIAFLSSPILGKYINIVGAKTMLSLGMVLAAISAICFGLLDYVEDHVTFITLSFALRMTESLGATAALVSAFSITAAVFPKSVATTFATLEAFYGLGYIVGPTVGGLLFSLGGYVLPFAVMGTTMMVGTIFVFIILPPINKLDNDLGHVKVKDVLKIPGVMLDSICTVATSISMGFLAATLEPHIREYGLSSIQNGLMFIISGGTYAVIAPGVGRLCDKWVYPKKMLTVGALFIVTSYVIIGPFPYLMIPKSLGLCIVGLVVHGFGLAALMVPTFIDSICSAVAAGFRDDIGTYGVISGLWSSSFALGAFIGPSVAGWLYDLVGFQYGTLFVISLHLLLFVGITIFISCERKSTVSPRRVRMLSHVPPESGTSEEEQFIKKITNDASWTEKITASNGKITKSTRIMANEKKEDARRQESKPEINETV
ncbi:solute carrier family 18, subfamily B, member 1 [Nesidiocoris tenuis]|uniref:Solute carrier family 18, subfamily B, member 1 n=1 Tax=Nesidiocoris tenuis TaxID=355587 RepID=A0ABN7AT45_9HEMI|nr:solute carrier family 18, subfamily B, member 1 [Nesidiocoris tenuis]